MPKVAPIQNSFLGGEFSPLAQGNVSNDAYKAGMALIDNYLPVIQGGLTRKQGFRYVHNCFPTATEAYLVPFVVSPERAYMMEFSYNTIRFFLNGALAMEGVEITITDISVAADGTITVTAPAHGLVFPSYQVIYDVVGMTELNNREFILQPISVDQVTVKDLYTGVLVDGTNYTPYVSGGEFDYIKTEVGFSDPANVRYAQSRNKMYVVGDSAFSGTLALAPRVIEVDEDGEFTVSDMEISDGPYLDDNDTTTTLDCSDFNVGTGRTLTASSATGINDGQGFLISDIGRMVRLLDSGVWGWGRITGYSNNLNVTFEVLSTLTTNNAKLVWALGLWSNTTGYPTVVAFHGDRLFLSGTPVAPNRIVGSVTGDYENFKPTQNDTSVVATNAISVTMNSKNDNTVRVLHSDEKGLVAITQESPWIIKSADPNSALSATTAEALEVASDGASKSAAVRAGKAVIYADTTTRKLNELRYFYDAEAHDTTALSDIAEHLFAAGVADICFQKDAHMVVWCRKRVQTGYNTERQLISATYKRRGDALVAAFAAHTLQNARIMSLATIPIQDADGAIQSELWAVIAREIGGEERLYVERLAPFFQTQTAAEDAFFVDSGKTYDSTPATVIGGLWHLEGEEVAILADGQSLPRQTVSEGKITLDVAASVVTAGIPLKARAKMLRLEAGSANGTALGKTRRTHRVGLLLDRTGGLSLGPDFDDLSEIPFRESSDPMDEAVPLFSGIKSETFAANYDFENNICWEQDNPLPGTVLAVMPQMATEDR